MGGKAGSKNPIVDPLVNILSKNNLMLVKIILLKQYYLS